MKVVHITPTYFDNASVIGGGERYPTELATWMAKQVPTTLVSFSNQRRSHTSGNLRVEVYPANHLLQGSKLNAFNGRSLLPILQADIVHIHHLNALTSAIAAVLADSLGKRVFITDYGGGSGLGWKLNEVLRVVPRYDGAIAYSEFGRKMLPDLLQSRTTLAKGGIDGDRFSPDSSVSRENTILYVGRILPHKGINYLVDAFRLLNRADYKLRIVGRVYHEAFYQDLCQQAQGLAVEFIHSADDDQLLQYYRSARVTVLPSVHTTCYGMYTPVPELMGFTLLESQACGTPVICTDAGAMPEFVDPDRTGVVVAQNSGAAIALALEALLDLSPSEMETMQQRCREWVRSLHWRVVVQRYLEAYQEVSHSR